MAADLDRKGVIPPEIIHGVADLGLLGCEHDFVVYVRALIEISKVWASLAAVISVDNSLVCYPISRFGDQDQKTRDPPMITERKQLGCYGFAEPLAGSDAGAIRTTGRRRRPFRAERAQALRDEWTAGTPCHHLRADRSFEGPRRPVGLHRRYLHARIFGGGDQRDARASRERSG